MAFQFAGKRAVITGAASGIGEATAHALAARGASVVLLDIHEEKLNAVACEIRRRSSASDLDVRGVDDRGNGSHVVARVETHVVDMADRDDVAAAGRTILNAGEVDILVNNAGVAVVAPFVRTSEEDWEWLLGVNVRGPLRLTQALLPSMIARKTGHIVVVSSLAGLVGAPGMVAYTTSKFALTGFAEALRMETKELGISVSVICPGYVRTNLHHATRYDNAGFKRFLDRAPAFYGMSADHVATELCDAIRKKRPLVVLGPEKIAFLLKRLAPRLSFALSCAIAKGSGIQ